MDEETPAKAATQEPAPASEETPAAAPAAEAETTPAPGTTTATVEEPGQEAGKDAVGVEGYEKMKAEAFALAAKPKEEAPPAEAAEEIPAATEEAPAAAAPATTTAAAAPTSEEEPAATTEEDDKDPVRIRIAGLEDSHLVASANRIARKEGITFTQAWERVAPKKEAPAAATAESRGTEAAPTLRTRDEIQAEITAKKAEKKQAAADLDTGKMYDTEEAIEALKEELGQVAAAEARTEQERDQAERTKFETTVATSKAKAVEYWPEADDKKSELSKRTEELADAYEKDPALAALVTEADSPFYFTQLAAKELGLLPKHLRKTPATTPAANPKPSTPAATKPAPRNQSAVVRPAQPAATPASGAARTTQGEPVDTLGLDKIRSPYDYEKVKEKALAMSQ